MNLLFHCVEETDRQLPIRVVQREDLDFLYFFQYENCICRNFKVYLLKFQNVFVIALCGGSGFAFAHPSGA